MEKAILVSVQLRNEEGRWRIEDTASELEELAVSAGFEVIDNVIAVCDKPTPNYLAGRGKIEEINLLAQDQGAEVIIFSHDLSGTQQRNIENLLNRKTIDRTQLILDIFSRRARSPEGKMQVELAQLQYLLPRLAGKGVMLSRLGGGIGTRGPGEQKLEIDRRQIRRKIDKLKRDLKQFRLHRQNTKKRRHDNNLPCVVLVGYTSAGKSTLINRLTQSEQPVSDKLFTTLDPLSRALKLANGQKIILFDTVGFLHRLPHHLIEAFKATLEEAQNADLLIHVLDAKDPRVQEHNQAVLDVLEDLEIKNKKMLTAFNKIDLIEDRAWLKGLKRDFPESVLISAKSAENLSELIAYIEKVFSGRMLNIKVLLSHSRMDLVDLFYRQAKVNSIEYLQKGIEIDLTLPAALYEKIVNEREIKIF